jgi:hypothetical protein
MFLSCLGKVGTISSLRFILVMLRKGFLKTHNLSQIKKCTLRGFDERWKNKEMEIRW